MKVLLVEDDYKMGRMTERGLQDAQFAVTWARSISEAEDVHQEQVFDLVVLDLGLPDGDGLDLLGKWRGKGVMEPVIILSARDSVADRVSGLEEGADDYLPKPFSMEELVARVKSQLRRKSADRESCIEARGIQLDLLERKVVFKGELLILTNREFELLSILMQNQGRVVSRGQIAERIWNSRHELQTNLIEVYIRKLRTMFDEPNEVSVIKTVRGVGYQFL